MEKTMWCKVENNCLSFKGKDVKILSTPLNKFLELTSPADLHICRISERVISSSPADLYIYERAKV
jgi:hypothetical protein